MLHLHDVTQCKLDLVHTQLAWEYVQIYDLNISKVIYAAAYPCHQPQYTHVSGTLGTLVAFLVSRYTTIATAYNRNNITTSLAFNNSTDSLLVPRS